MSQKSLVAGRLKTALSQNPMSYKHTGLRGEDSLKENKALIKRVQNRRSFTVQQQ